MSRTAIILVLLVIAYTYVYSVSASCPRNQVWKNCGTACEAKCNHPPQPNCPSVCVTGCQCADGFVKNSANQCVLPKQC